MLKAQELPVYRRHDFVVSRAAEARDPRPELTILLAFTVILVPLLWGVCDAVLKGLPLFEILWSR